MTKPTYDQLVTAMEEYGRHTANCRVIQSLHVGGSAGGCDCGLDKFMKRIETFDKFVERLETKEASDE